MGEQILEFSPEGMTEEQIIEFQRIYKRFIRKYEEMPDKPTAEWLSEQLKEEMPDKNDGEIQKISSDIIDAVSDYDKNLQDLNRRCLNGETKESWFAKKIMDSAKNTGINRMAEYLTKTDEYHRKASEALWKAKSVSAADGTISQNPNLDGFIAEQYHAQTFNMNAEASGSEYRAKVLEPDGTGYQKNSVDIEILDGNGKVVKRYQSKYCKNARATEKAFEKGDYRGQQKLVPDGQKDEIRKKATTVLEAPDGTTSNPLSKERAQQMRDEAQSGTARDLGYNDYQLKDLALNVGKQAGNVGIQAAFFGMGVHAVQKVMNGEDVEVDEVVEAGVAVGSDAFVKTAAGGALKVASEKELISLIPKGTSANTITQIACMGAENVKILWKAAKGEMTMSEAANEMGKTNVALFAGLKTAAVGAAKGAAILSGIPVVGQLAGGLAGGTIGYITGSSVGEKVYEGAKKAAEYGFEVVKKYAEKAVKAAKKVTSFLSR